MAKGWIKRLKTKVKMVLKGPEYYASTGGKHAKHAYVKPKKSKKSKKPTYLGPKKIGTMVTEEGMRAAGLSEKEIARFGGK